MTVVQQLLQVIFAGYKVTVDKRLQKAVQFWLHPLQIGIVP
jgi:hypothetical protein